MARQNAAPLGRSGNRGKAEHALPEVSKRGCLPGGAVLLYGVPAFDPQLAQGNQSTLHVRRTRDKLSACRLEG